MIFPNTAKQQAWIHLVYTQGIRNIYSMKQAAGRFPTEILKIAWKSSQLSYAKDYAIHRFTCPELSQTHHNWIVLNMSIQHNAVFQL